MSRTLNKVQLIGNLGADPEVRSTTNGTKVATLSLATKTEWNSRDGSAQSRTDWHRIVLWAGRADVAQKYLKKGSRIYIEGTLEYRSYTDREGTERWITEIRASDLVMLDAPRASTSGAPADAPHTADLARDEELVLVGTH